MVIRHQVMPAVPPAAPAAEAHSTDNSARPTPPPKFDNCRIRLRIDDLKHPGVAKFLTNVNSGEDLEQQVQNVVRLLYNADSKLPGTRSVTFILRAHGGLAYTTGIDLDDDHKEIHLDLDYVAGLNGDVRHELLGVLCHELVHCFQWDANKTCPGGLIEGMADWVRLNAGLGAAHWRRDTSGNWDQGYERTGYFLDYLEKRFGAGTVRKINAHLGECDYDEKELFGSCCHGHSVDKLWNDYCEEVDHGTSSATESPDPPFPVPTHPAK